MIKRRRIAPAFAAFWFLVFSVVPNKPAHALAPLVGVLVGGLSGAGTVSVPSIVGASVNALIGGTIVALAITPQVAGQGSDVVSRVPLTTSAASSAAMPAPSAPAVVPAEGAVPASPVMNCSAQRCDAYGCGVSDISVSACIVNYAGAGGTRYCNVSTSCSANTTGSPIQINNANLPSYAGSPGTCGSGYSASGSNCNLVNARAAVTDGNYDVGRSGTTLSDPGATGEKDSKPGNISVNGTGQGQIWGKDASGNPFVTTITPTTNGGSVIETKRQVGNQVLTQSITTDAGGGVSNVAGAAAAGSITAGATAGAVPTVNTGAAANPVDIAFPDDYAREASAQRTAAASERTATAVENMLKTSNAPDAPPLPDAQTGFANQFFNGTFQNLISWGLPGHSSQCPTGSFNWGDKNYSINSHCQLINDHFSGLQNAMTVVWVIGALFIVLAA